MSNLIHINKDYAAWIGELKIRIRQSQIKAAVKVNTELLQLYWQLGSDIVEKQKNAKWGDGFLKQLSQDLSAEFPEMKGFSLRNIERIRKWYITYKDVFPFATQLVPQIKNGTTCAAIFLLYSLGASHPYYAAMQGYEHGFVLHPTDH